MSIFKKKHAQVKRRMLRARARINTKNMPRVSVFRSSKNVYAQLIDDKEHNTIVSCSSLEMKELTGDKKQKAKAVGLELAKRILDKGIKKVCFDRGSFLYHGRVKSLAEGLREGGLEV